MQQTEMDIPRKVAHLGGMIEKTATGMFRSVARATNFRCPEHLLCEVDAMGQMAGKSRNAMLIYLIDAAIEEVRGTLDEDTIYALNAEVSQRQTLMISDVSDRQEVEA